MQPNDIEQDPGKIKAIASAYADFKKRFADLEQQQQALLKEAMGILKEDHMQAARKKLENILAK